MSIEPIKYSKLLLMYATAKAFHNEYENVYSNLVNEKKLGVEGNYMSVVVVNASFSLELYLKWIYAYRYWINHESTKIKEEQLDSTEFVKGHDLKKLFNELEDVDKNEIIKKLDEIGIDRLQVDAFFDKYKEAFKTWRYIFESSTNFDADKDSIQKVLGVLSEYCDKLNRNYHPREEWLSSIPIIGMDIPFEDLKTKEDD